MQTEYCSLDLEQRTSIAKNLRQLIALNNLTETKFAKELNIPVMTIRRLLSGETIDPRISTLKMIADYLGVSIDSLIGSKKITLQELSNPAKPIFVPVLNWGEVLNFENIELTKWKNWIPITLRNNEVQRAKLFALESRPSMFPPFQTGTIFIFDPTLRPSDGDLVLISLRETGELTLRELSIDPPEWRLHSVNQMSSILNFSSEHHKVIAVVFLTLFYNRKDWS